MLQIWSLEHDDPVYTLNVGSDCFSLAWRLNGDDDDADSEDPLKHLLIAGYAIEPTRPLVSALIFM